MTRDGQEFNPPGGVRPAQALGLKPSIFGILVIGSDHLPFRIQIPTMLHPYISPSIAPPISPSLCTHTHTHTLSLSLSLPSPCHLLPTCSPSHCNGHHQSPCKFVGHSLTSQTFLCLMLHSTPLVDHFSHAALSLTVAQLHSF